MPKQRPTSPNHTHREFPSDPDALYREREAAEFLDFTPRALQLWRRTGDGPRFVRVSSRAIRYRRRDLVAWAEARLAESTAQ